MVCGQSWRRIPSTGSRHDVSTGFTVVSDLAQPRIAASVKTRRLGSPAFHHRNEMVERAMPRKRTTIGTAGRQQVCGRAESHGIIKEKAGLRVDGSSASTSEAKGTLKHNSCELALSAWGKKHNLDDAVTCSCETIRRRVGGVVSDCGYEIARDLALSLGISIENGAAAKYRIDYERYRELFDDPNLDDEHKDQMIEILVLIGHGFYDFGFAYEFADERCGKLAESQEDSPAERKSVLYSESATLTEKFNQCAAE